MLRYIAADFRKSRNSTKFFRSFNYARAATPVINIIFRSSRQEVFLEISQNSQENTCVRDSFLTCSVQKGFQKQDLLHI